MQLPDVSQNAAPGSTNQEIPFAVWFQLLSHRDGIQQHLLGFGSGAGTASKSLLPKPVLPQSTAGMDKSAGEGSGADA